MHREAPQRPAYDQIIETQTKARKKGKNFVIEHVRDRFAKRVYVFFCGGRVGQATVASGHLFETFVQLKGKEYTIRKK